MQGNTGQSGRWAGSHHELHIALVALQPKGAKMIAEFNQPISFTDLNAVAANVPVSFVAPEQEGVYEVVATLRNPAMLRLNTPVLRANQQFIVFNPRLPARPVGALSVSPATQDLLTESKRSPLAFRLKPFPKVAGLPKGSDFARLGKLPKMPKFWERGNETDHPIPAANNFTENNLTDNSTGIWNDLVRMHAESNGGGGFGIDAVHDDGFGLIVLAPTGWWALPIPVSEINKPYQIEIEIDYSSNDSAEHSPGNSQNHSPKPGIAVVEFNEQQPQILFASELAQQEEMAHQQPEVQTVKTQQIIVWVKSTSPYLVLVNRDTQKPCSIKGVRLAEILPTLGDDTNRLPKLFEGQAQRKILYNDLSPRFTENHHDASNSSASLFQTTAQYVDLLCRNGYDGAMFTVLSKDVQLYCGARTFSEKRQNDTLELLFRHFDREKLTLIPAIEFNMPVAMLETLLQQNPAMSKEIRFNEQDYNILNPIVQDALTDIVRELAERFGKHPSFGGVAIRLTPQSYAQLPLEYFSASRATAAQFQASLESLTQFYTRLASGTAAQKNGAKLYLDIGTLFEQESVKQYCTAALPQRSSPVHVLHRCGLDLKRLNETQAVVVVKPNRTGGNPGLSATDYCYGALNERDAIPLFAKNGAITAVELFAPTYEHFVAAAKDAQSRRPLIKQLAQCDVISCFDENVLNLNRNDSALCDVLETYRCLPNAAFQNFNTGNESVQPLTVRHYKTDQALYVYLLNDAPYQIEAAMTFDAPTGAALNELTSKRMIRPLNGNVWRATLMPYDLLAVRLDDPNASIQKAEVSRPDNMCGENGLYRQKVEELSQRLHTVRNGIHWDKLLNPDFETESGWQAFGQNLRVEFDPNHYHDGKTSIRLTNDLTNNGLTNAAGSVGALMSTEFECPSTQRLWLTAFVGMLPNAAEIPLEIVLSAKYLGHDYNSSAAVGASLLAKLPGIRPQNGVCWQQVVVPFDQLPVEGLENLRIGFQLTGHGAVWIDNVKLYSVAFSSDEMVELQKILLAADSRCKEKRFTDLSNLLEGYWAQYLFRNVSSPTPQLVSSRANPKVSAQQIVPKPPETRPTMYENVKGWFGKSWFGGK
ncbi:hypothetical protein FACS189443_4800 [Planctomycetales bacterium]|nr:hypothetical protein FACS189443_4800 [Planctomycetales bacterium]